MTAKRTFALAMAAFWAWAIWDMQQWRLGRR